MFNPESTITVADWMLQSVTKAVTKTRAQALTTKGNEHKHAEWGERTTENATFTLGGAYAANGNMTLPQIGSTNITDYQVDYSETDFPALAVNKDSGAVGSAAFSLPFSLPVRTLGVPTQIANVYTAIGAQAVKKLSVKVAGTHAETTDGQGAYGTLGEFRDIVVTVTFEGVSGKPNPTMASGWTDVTNQEGNSNTAIPTGSIVYEKHFAFSTDADAENNVAAGGGTGGGSGS